MSAPRLEVMSRRLPQHGTRDGTRLRARETHHADAAVSQRRSYGDDGVVKMHGEHYSPRRHRDIEALRFSNPIDVIQTSECESRAAAKSAKRSAKGGLYLRRDTGGAGGLPW